MWRKLTTALLLILVAAACEAAPRLRVSGGFYIELQPKMPGAHWLLTLSPEGSFRFEHRRVGRESTRGHIVETYSGEWSERVGLLVLHRSDGAEEIFDLAETSGKLLLQSRRSDKADLHWSESLIID